VHIEGDDVSLVRWNHRPALLRDALRRFGGMAVWKPRWYTSWRARRKPSLAVHEACSAWRRRTNGESASFRTLRTPDHLAPSAANPAGRHVEEIWAEQEAKNAELHRIDHSHIPPLRIADRYAAGRPRPR
jgi:hypothetical protein